MIISISGLKGSGKDTVGDILIKHLNFQRVSFADSLKKICAEAFDIPLETFHRVDLKDKPFETPVVFRERACMNLADILNERGFSNTSALSGFIGMKFESPRDLLVKVGTHMCRKTVDREIWLKIAIADLEGKEGLFVVTDSRFQNERDALKNIGGFTIFIDRPSVSAIFDRSTADVSETEQLDDTYNMTFTNSGTLDGLRSDILMYMHLKFKMS